MGNVASYEESMKTNHQRGFKEKRSSRHDFSHGGSYMKVTEDGKVILAAGGGWGDACRGKRGLRRDKAGAKKFVNSRERFHSKAALRRYFEL